MKLSPEERIERKREYQKRYHQNMTEEEKEKVREESKRYQEIYRQNRTKEQKKKSKEYQKSISSE